MGTRFVYFILYLQLFAALFAIPQIGAASEQQMSMEQRVQLLDVEFVTQFDSQIGSGGFDTSTTFDRRLVSAVEMCVDAVTKATMDWAERNRLSVLKSSIDKLHEPREVYLQFLAEKLHGIYEVKYRVNVGQGLAQGSFWFYDLTGEHHSPDPIQYKNFRKDLIKAMQCSKY